MNGQSKKVSNIRFSKLDKIIRNIYIRKKNISNS